MEMMVKSLLSSLGIDPKMIAGVAAAVQSAAADLRAIKLQNDEILRRISALEQKQPEETQKLLAEVSSGG